jgi:TPP-dependent pyruvate/acetoin dehydrogenase alpha subunit
MLLKQGVLDEARLKQMTEEADAEVREAIRFATEAAPPDPASVSKYVFSER